jgi:hypothetical protein
MKNKIIVKRFWESDGDALVWMNPEQRYQNDDPTAICWWE